MARVGMAGGGGGGLDVCYCFACKPCAKRHDGTPRFCKRSGHFSMRALGIVGKPSASKVVSVLRELELPDPVPRKNEVCVRTAASTVNIDDIHAMKGTLFGGIPMYVSVSERRPFIPGMDISGTVISKSPQVRRFELGDKF